MHIARITIALAIVMLLAVVAAFDLWCAGKGDYRNTVSATIQDWSVQIPAIPFACGAVAAHLFWPHRPN